jgi:hypothetical protein
MFGQRIHEIQSLAWLLGCEEGTRRLVGCRSWLYVAFPVLKG